MSPSDPMGRAFPRFGTLLDCRFQVHSFVRRVHPRNGSWSVCRPRALTRRWRCLVPGAPGQGTRPTAASSPPRPHSQGEPLDSCPCVHPPGWEGPFLVLKSSSTAVSRFVPWFGGFVSLIGDLRFRSLLLFDHLAACQETRSPSHPRNGGRRRSQNEGGAFQHGRIGVPRCFRWVPTGSSLAGIQGSARSMDSIREWPASGRIAPTERPMPAREAGLDQPRTMRPSCSARVRAWVRPTTWSFL